MKLQITDLINSFDHKLFLLLGVVSLIFIWILINAFQLQIIEGQEYLTLSKQLGSKVHTLYAPRGLFLDRNGQALVENKPVFKLYVLPGELQEEPEKVFDVVASVFSKDKESMLEFYKSKAYNSEGQLLGQRITMISDLDYEAYLDNFRQITALEGVYVSVEPQRNYLESEAFAHILGYMGDPQEQSDTNQLQVGRAGLEKAFEDQLKGKAGAQIENEFETWIPESPVAGDNVELSLDKDWQIWLYNLMQNRVENSEALGASGVVLKADSGEIAAMVNYPGFDANQFSGGIDSAVYQELVDNDSSPLLNRAIAMQIPTGSIFKVVMAAALQEEDVLSRNSVYASGCHELPGDYKICEADLKTYGDLNLPQALAKSSNAYFCQAAVDLANQAGGDDAAIGVLNDYFQRLGLGQAPEIALEGAQPGTMPSPALKQSRQGEPWYLADLCNTAIGQGLVTATPLQMARAAGAIVNGGRLPEVTFRKGDTTQSQNLGLSEQNLQVIQEGMRSAAQEPYAHTLKDVPGSAMIKTGSSEAKVILPSGDIKEGAHSWVIGAFEYKGERYAFAFVQQFGGRGFRTVPVLSEFLKCIHGEEQVCKVE